jgi:hypothetical protein
VRRPAAFSPVWWQEWGLTTMLVSLLLALFVGAPLMAMAGVGQLAFDAFFTVMLLSGVVAFGRRRILAIAVAVLGLVVQVMRWTGYGAATPALVVWDDAMTLLLLAILTGLVLEHVFREGPITGDRIRGAIAAYLLIGLVWVFAYRLVDYLSPGALSIGPLDRTPGRGPQTVAYFSFVTLTTLGYGDITPIHPAARVLAIAEALVGQLYPAILLGRLVSLQISSRTEK